MEVVILPTPQDVCLRAARIVERLVRYHPRAVLGLCTGSTPVPVYAELVRLHREEDLDFSEVTTFNLDEFVGLDPSHPASYLTYMAEHFFEHVNVPPSRMYIPDGTADDIPRTCFEYESAIREAGGIDLQLLGIGSDGHIGFNEPTSSLSSRTRVKTLTEKTRSALEHAGEPIPQHVITMGVGTILEARRCLLLAHGAQKAQAVAKMIEGPLSAMVPASALQMHRHATILLDEAAAAELELRAYYRQVELNKPDWQRED
jgi:glucosamine-6-phosphate deaminase